MTDAIPPIERQRADPEVLAERHRARNRNAGMTTEQVEAHKARNRRSGMTPKRVEGRRTYEKRRRKQPGRMAYERERDLRRGNRGWSRHLPANPEIVAWDGEA